MKTINWTSDAITLLRKLHGEGLSAALIGEQIGTTKNAVCGKAHRLGLVLGTPHTKHDEEKRVKAAARAVRAVRRTPDVAA